MKHLFYAHSGITFLVSLATIQKLNLNQDQVVFIFARGFLYPVEYTFLELDQAQNEIVKIPSYGSKMVLRNLQTLRGLDKKIENLGGDEFVLYLPTERNFLMQFLQSHSHCVQRNFLEEGILTYHKTFEKAPITSNSRKGKIKHWIRFPFHLGRTNVKPFFAKKPASQETSKVFVATKRAYGLLKSENVSLVDTQSLKLDFPEEFLKIRHFLVFDIVLEANCCLPIHFRKCFDEFVGKELNEDMIVYVKFHPLQKDLAHYLEVFERYKISYVILPSNLIPELILARVENLKVYGLSSSVLLYANEWGHKTISFSEALASVDTTYRDYVKKSFPISVIESLKLL